MKEPIAIIKKEYFLIRYVTIATWNMHLIFFVLNLFRNNYFCDMQEIEFYLYWDLMVQKCRGVELMTEIIFNIESCCGMININFFVQRNKGFIKFLVCLTYPYSRKKFLEALTFVTITSKRQTLDNMMLLVLVADSIIIT